MKVIADIEANGFNPDRIFCVVCKDYATGKVYKFKEKEVYNEFVEFAKGVSHWVFHNAIGYDVPVLNRLLNLGIRLDDLTDTVVLSRLFNSLRERPKGASSPHSLEGWGLALGYPKTNYSNWEYYEPEMLEYCLNDVEVLYRVYEYLMREGKGFSETSIRLEHQSQAVLEKQRQRGWYIDERKAQLLRAELTDKHTTLEKLITEGMLPLPTPEKVKGEVKVRSPKYKQDGTLSPVGLSKFGDDWVHVGGDFCLIKKYQPFDLGSPAQKVERLEGYWSPTVKTKSGKSWQICEENLATLHPDAPPALKYLAEHAMLVSRCNMIDDWLNNTWGDSRVHGRVVSVGAATHRMAHQNPNSANIPSHGPYGKECRELWTVDDPVNRRIVGVDAAGIQLRILAHYMNDPEYTKEVCDGDIHTKNLIALGIDKGEMIDGKWTKRDVAKTFIYAFLLGAGDLKIALICGDDEVRKFHKTNLDKPVTDSMRVSFGRATRERFLENTPGLAALKKRTDRDAQRGYMVGLDGRRIPIKSAHFALSVYLQSGETIIMRKAMVDAYMKVQSLGLDAHQVGIIHDEFQIDCHKDCAEQVRQIYMQAIIDAGTYFKTKCPMDADGRIGVNWYETH